MPLKRVYRPFQKLEWRHLTFECFYYITALIATKNKTKGLLIWRGSVMSTMHSTLQGNSETPCAKTYAIFVEYVGCVDR